MHIDERLKIFQGIKSKFSLDYSETDTRIKLIDSVFKECLDWDEKDITRETHVHEGFVDYIFRIEGKVSFILEAKRSDEHFEIPKDKTSRHYQLNGVIGKTPNLMEAIEQVQKYCTDQGANIAIVSNGHQYVIFEAFKTGKSWREGQCIIYNSLDDIESDFSTFISLLLYENVAKGSLYRCLSERHRLYFKRPLEAVHNKDAILTRNYLSNFVSPFIKYLFLDITNNNQIDVLRKCYVHKKSVYDFNEPLNYIDDLPSFHKSEGVRGVLERSDNAGAFQENYRQWKQRGGEQVVFILGGIGAGKTTFLHRFFNIILEKDRKVWFYIDAKKGPVSKDELGKYFNDCIITQFKTKINLLSKKNQEIVRDLYTENTADYIKNIFTILRSEGFSLSLVIDNVDKCPSELQELIIVESTFVANLYETFTVISLREETYYKFKSAGILDQYHTTKFHISSPRFEDLILVRIEYLLNLLNKDDSEISAEIGHNVDFAEHKDDVKMFFEILKYSLTRKEASLMQPITWFVTSISEGNMREALDLFNNFLRSGNTKVEEMLGACKKAGKIVYLIHEYQFFKSVILDDYRYYTSEKSKILNLFEPNTELVDSHFVLLRLLNYAFVNQTNAPTAGRGFVNINSVITEFQKFYFDSEAVKDALNKLIKFNLIVFDVESKDLRQATFFKITANGRYYLHHIRNKFIYNSIIQFDTPISDPKLVEHLHAHIDEQLLYKRVELTKLFLHYLKAQEDKEFAANPEYSSSDLMKSRFMARTLTIFEKEVEWVLKKAERKRQKYQDDSITIGDFA